MEPYKQLYYNILIYRTPLNTKIENIPTGNYTWAIGIIDMEKEDPTIGIKLSVSKNVTSKGWLKLRDVIVK